MCSIFLCMRPIFYYDAACPFCCRCAKAWKQKTHGVVDFQALQGSPYTLDSVVFVTQEGIEYQRVRAVVEMLAYQPNRRLWRWVYLYIPFCGRIFEWLYKQLSSCRECAEKFGWVFYKNE